MKSILLIPFCFVLSFSGFSQNEEDPAPNFSEGQFNLLTGNYRRAIDYLDIAIENNESIAQSYYYRGKAYVGLESYSQAYGDLSKAIELDPENAEAYIARSYVYAKFEGFEEAENDLKTAEGIHPDYSTLNQSYGFLYYYSRESEKAIPYLTAHLNEKEKDKEVLLQRAQCYQRLDKIDEACNDFAMLRKLGQEDLEDYIEIDCSLATISEENQMTEYDWNNYADEDYYHSYNATEVVNYDYKDPASLVRYFYASKVRGDTKWEEVITPVGKRSQKLEYALEAYENLKLEGFTLKSIKRFSENRWWIKVSFKMVINTSLRNVDDEVTVERQEDGTYIIVGLPT